VNQATLFDRVNPEPCREPGTPYAAHQAELASEAQRLESAKARILARLQAGPATNHELNGIAFRYGARLLELRREGHAITSEQVGGGVWVYALAAKETR
jgi:hypothetical protein